MPHDTFPRIQVFTAERLKTMILADTVRHPSCQSEVEFGLSHPRNRQESSYYKDNGIEQPNEEDYLWQISCRLCALLQLPNDAQHKVYTHMKEYEDNVFVKVEQLVHSLNQEFYSRIEVIAKQFDKSAITTTQINSAGSVVQSDLMSNKDAPVLGIVSNATRDITTSLRSKTAAFGVLPGGHNSHKRCMGGIDVSGPSKKARIFTNKRENVIWQHLWLTKS